MSVLSYLELNGMATARRIQEETGLTQATVSRQLRALKDKVVIIKKGRTPWYALTRNAFGADDRLKLAMIDVDGNATIAAEIRPLAQGGFFIEARTGVPSVLLGDKGDGFYEDLPWFLQDLSPQGFLGRQIVRQIADQSESFPADPRRWSSSHIGRYLVAEGGDLPGNFQLGPAAGMRLRRSPESISDDDYPRLAEAVMDGVLPGSSAGGEQPKFTTWNRQQSAHVIVKFSPKGNEPSSQRWRDILLTEFHASMVLNAHSYPAAETRLIDRGERLFLESRRFDRHGEFGRTSMVSLSAIDAEFTGLGSSWLEVATALYERKLISGQHVYDISLLWYFGKMINNTDMHLGNLSFGIEGDVFRLLPVYDMCSMGFAPKSNNEVRPYQFAVPKMESLPPEQAAQLKKMADEFWMRLLGDERVSKEFRSFIIDEGLVERRLL